MTATDWVANIWDFIAELRASRRHITNAEDQEQIDALFEKTRGGNKPLAKTEVIP